MATSVGRVLVGNKPSASSRLIHISLLLLGIAGAAFLISWLPLRLVVLGVGGTAVLLAVTLRPVIGIYLLAFTIPFGSLYQVNLGSVILDISDLLVALITLAWFLQFTALRQDHLVRGGWWSISLGVFLISLLLGLLPSINLVEAAKELLKWLEFSLVFFFVVNRVKLSEIESIMAVLLAAGVLEALYGISQFFSGQGPEAFVFLGQYTRAFGTFEQPNPYGGYLGLLLPLAYSIVLTSWPGVLIGRNKVTGIHAITWWLALASVVILSAALVMSGSRGALAGLAAGAVLVIMVLLRRQWPILAVLLVLSLVAGPLLIGLVPPVYLARITEVFTLPLTTNLEFIEITDANFSLIERAAHWVAAWRMFSLHPWFGVGLGQYAAVYPLVALSRWINPLGHAHNYLLNVLAEGGIVGLLVYLVFQVTLLAQAVRAAIGKVRAIHRLGLAGVGMWAALFTHNLFDNLYVHHLPIIVSLVFGMIILVVLSNHSTGEAI